MEEPGHMFPPQQCPPHVGNTLWVPETDTLFLSISMRNLIYRKWAQEDVSNNKQNDYNVIL